MWLPRAAISAPPCEARRPRLLPELYHVEVPIAEAADERKATISTTCQMLEREASVLRPLARNARTYLKKQIKQIH